eukprot:jgi/Ulvmu1/12284/UM087_0018.1
MGCLVLLQHAPTLWPQLQFGLPVNSCTFVMCNSTEHSGCRIDYSWLPVARACNCRFVQCSWLQCRLCGFSGRFQLFSAAKTEHRPAHKCTHISAMLACMKRL